MLRALGSSPSMAQIDFLVNTCYPSSWEVETNRSKVALHPWLHAELRLATDLSFGYLATDHKYLLCARHSSRGLEMPLGKGRFCLAMEDSY